MIAEWLQDYWTWFEFPTNMAWFIGFWLFVGFLFVLEILVPAFQREPKGAIVGQPTSGLAW